MRGAKGSDTLRGSLLLFRGDSWKLAKRFFPHKNQIKTIDSLWDSLPHPKSIYLINLHVAYSVANSLGSLLLLLTSYLRAQVLYGYTYGEELITQSLRIFVFTEIKSVTETMRRISSVQNWSFDPGTPLYAICPNVMWLIVLSPGHSTIWSTTKEWNWISAFRWRCRRKGTWFQTQNPIVTNLGCLLPGTFWSNFQHE